MVGESPSPAREMFANTEAGSLGAKGNAGGEGRLAPWMGPIQPVLEGFLVEIGLQWR